MPNCSPKKLASLSWTEWTECLSPPKVHMLKPQPQGEGFRRWSLWRELGHESGLVGLMPLSGETERKLGMWGHSRKVDTCKPGREWIDWHLDLGILRLQNSERIHFSYLRPPAMEFCSGSLRRLKDRLSPTSVTCGNPSPHSSLPVESRSFQSLPTWYVKNKSTFSLHFHLLLLMMLTLNKEYSLVLLGKISLSFDHLPMWYAKPVDFERMVVSFWSCLVNN